MRRSICSLWAGCILVWFASARLQADDSQTRKPTKPDRSTGVEAQDIPTVSLLDALRDGSVSADAEGTGDGRTTISLTNRTKHRLNVVLPPGIIAQGATGQFGGMDGMMGGGMRSVPPTGLPFAGLAPGQTRHLPTRLVSLSPPDPDRGLKLPEKGEQLQISDVSAATTDGRIQKALKRLGSEKASETLSQLVMWQLAAGLDWNTIAGLSGKWANRYELALAEGFVDHLDTLPDGEAGRLLFGVEANNPANEVIAAQVCKALQEKLVLGLTAEIGIPPRPEGPGVYCRVRITDDQALAQVGSSDAAAEKWVPFGKFSLPVAQPGQPFDATRFVAALAEGIVNRLVRTQLTKGPREKGQQSYRIRIENASPMILNGLAAVGITSKDDETPRILAGISIPPRKHMTVPASEELVKKLGLRKGIRIVALDLSAL